MVSTLISLIRPRIIPIFIYTKNLFLIHISYMVSKVKKEVQKGS